MCVSTCVFGTSASVHVTSVLPCPVVVGANPNSGFGDVASIIGHFLRAGCTRARADIKACFASLRKTYKSCSQVLALVSRIYVYVHASLHIHITFLCDVQTLYMCWFCVSCLLVGFACCVCCVSIPCYVFACLFPCCSLCSFLRLFVIGWLVYLMLFSFIW